MSTIGAPGILNAIEDLPEPAISETGIMPPQGVISVAGVGTAIGTDAYQPGAKSATRSTVRQSKRTIAAAADPSLSSHDEVLLALDEAVMMQAETEHPVAPDPSHDRDFVPVADDGQHALNFLT